MTWLVPLGLIALASILVLIIIYIIKPNYQQKLVSSTYVWKLSLKYKKRRIPINKLNNILIFLCQLLILSICSVLLARPVIANEKIGDESERIIIIDASASMLLSDGNNTRFERAVTDASVLAEQTHENGGIVSVILADETPEFIVQRLSSDNSEELKLGMTSLTEGNTRCSYSSADMEGAIALAEEVLAYNYEAQIHLFTATNYIEKNGVFVHDVSAADEWNAAVLGCTATLDNENHYEITVDLGCFSNETKDFTVYCQINGANGKVQSEAPFHEPIGKSAFFDPSDDRQTVTFNSDDFGGEYLYSFDYIEVYVEVDDNFEKDNFFSLYGGTRPTIRVQYASSIPNNYFGGIVRTIREKMKGDWRIEFKELKADQKAATEGFDLYIFEHRMPDVMPTDGVVLLVDPSGSPDGSGIHFGGTYNVDKSSTLAAGTPHKLTEYVDSSRVTIAKYTEIQSSDGYEELAYYNGRPVILAKNEDNAKVVVWAFDLNYSNLIAMPDFSFLMYNLFNYYIPSTFDSYSYEIGDTVSLTGRGTELKLSGNGEEITFEGNRGEYTVTAPGNYTVTQKPMAGDELIIESFFVGIPNYESDVTKEVDFIPPASVEIVTEIEFEDLIFYFAIALVSLLFVEWILQSKKNY
ncbi:MAG: VWA domain-containing protein [Clostridia bacterium]|nr:VWA domain-containing protein [Clostridia bacterium]